jgi:hypothetical protein
LVSKQGALASFTCRGKQIPAILHHECDLIDRGDVDLNPNQNINYYLRTTPALERETRLKTECEGLVAQFFETEMAHKELTKNQLVEEQKKTQRLQKENADLRKKLKETEQLLASKT